MFFLFLTLISNDDNSIDGTIWEFVVFCLLIELSFSGLLFNVFWKVIGIYFCVDCICNGKGIVLYLGKVKGIWLDFDCKVRLIGIFTFDLFISLNGIIPGTVMEICSLTSFNYFFFLLLFLETLQLSNPDSEYLF